MSQVYVDGHNIQNRSDIQFIKLQLVGSLLKNDYACIVDYGQKQLFLPSSSVYLTEQAYKNDENMEQKRFLSDISMLNWFYAKNWDLVQVVHKETGGDTTNNRLVYIMRRKKHDF